MIRHLTFAALLVAGSSSLALAEDHSPGGPERHDRMGEFRDERPGGPRHGERRRDRWERHRMAAMGTGFEIEIWPGRSIEVRCGSEPVAECAQSMKPVLDALIAAPPPPMPGGPPHHAGPPPRGPDGPAGGPGGRMGAGDGPAVDVPLPPGARDGTPPPPPETLRGDAPPPPPAN